MPNRSADPELVELVRSSLRAPPDPAPDVASTIGPGWVPAEAPGPRPPRVLTMPTFLRTARMRISRPALAGLLALVIAAAAVFLLRIDVAQHQGDPVPAAAGRSGLVARSLPAGFTAISTARASPSAVESSGAGAPASGGPTTAAGGGGGPPTALVHVVGMVASPGVVTLGAGGRVADAVTKAGGALPSADLERVNLARPVTDGEQVHVPAPGEPLHAAGPVPGAGTSGTGPAGAAAGAAAPRPLVDLNTADVAALDTLPGVGPVLAQRIVEWRAAHARFSSVEELSEVSGIGEKLLAQLKDKVTV